ncbi:prolyl oligopeptidase family serine peptidase [Caballeronia sp. M1242]|uniref:extracellular catalytic domain type 2 short-chain-length polyhydroxyalkanoate depolymerase n=1 Tax=Caballeronia sp. M1242 TaxID=2814653 RepID=UPI0019D2540B|nr:prolyl oligopeptidase family serine peptidase [Caballeronia sp. M1242]QSN64463.1 prolyl oligopeptidase family serine peptidase [Caballeronia sp. M1242]
MRAISAGVRCASAISLAFCIAACGGGESAVTDSAVAKASAHVSASSATDNAALNGESQHAATVRLQRYAIDPSKVFVAGISSGGFAAVQMHVAHSATFKGAAIYAGGVYWCAGLGGAATALANCGGLTLPTNQASYNSTLVASETYLDAQSALGTIDSSTNLRGQPVYLWSGTQDEVVNPLEMADLRSEYQHYGAKIHFDNAFPAAHGWESPDGELACGTSGSPYMVRCSANGAVYDSVKTWLTMFIGPLKPRNGGKLSGSLLTFDQTEFGASPNLSMSSTGSVFVPKACAQGQQCGLVLALHGCLQQASLIGNRWVTEAGINEWADTNKLVVIYPDTVASSAPGPTNPNACFDWWGYSNQYDPNYALKSGAQLSVLYAMVQRVTGRP